jgi:TolB-like protein/tetratricopeptide (TPR) repeat protein
MAQEHILRSWKGISSYLGVNAKTCRRWEVEHGLPIHRIHSGSHRSPVFAYVSELESWLAEKPLLSTVGPAGRAHARGRRKLAAWGIGGLGSALLAAAFLIFSPRSPFKALPGDLSIAVVPFEDLDRSPQNAYFSEGVTHEIINDLARYGRVRVFPAAETAEAVLSPGSLEGIHSAIRADYLLRGGIRRESGNIHLDIEVTRVRDRSRILSLKLDESLDKPFTIIDSVCGKISESLGLNQDPGQPDAPAEAKKRATPFAAFDSYLKGNYVADRYDLRDDTDPWQLYNQGKYYWGQSTREGNDLAIQLFNQALEVDGAFAQACIGLAYCFSNFVNYGWDVQPHWLDKAEELLARAQSITPDLPEYFSCRAEVNLIKFGFSDLSTKSRDIAYGLADKGIRLYPTFPLLNSIEGYCHFMKFGETGFEEDFRKALEYKSRSYASNPYAFGNIVYAEFLMLDRNFDKALSVCELLMKNDPENIAKCRLGEIYYHQGELDKSRAIMEELMDCTKLDIRIWALNYLGMIAAQRGNGEEARRIRNELTTLSPHKPNYPENMIKMASITLGIGERKAGFRLLEEFFDVPRVRLTPHIYRRYIDIDKNFDRYRDEPEFRRIIGKGIRPRPGAESSGSLHMSKNVSTN